MNFDDRIGERSGHRQRGPNPTNDHRLRLCSSNDESANHCVVTCLDTQARGNVEQGGVGVAVGVGVGIAVGLYSSALARMTPVS